MFHGIKKSEVKELTEEEKARDEITTKKTKSNTRSNSKN